MAMMMISKTMNESRRREMTMMMISKTMNEIQTTHFDIKFFRKRVLLL